MSSLFGPSKQQNALASQETSNASQGSQIASNLAPGGEEALGTAQNFWQSILNGNPAARAQQLAGTVNPIQSASRAAETSALEFLPRGGGQTQTLSQIPYQRANAVSTAETNLTAQAPNELAQLGEAEIGGATSALNSSTGAASSALNFLTNEQQMQNASLTSLGEGAGSFLSWFSGTEAGQGLLGALGLGG
jgi:hypothetical protein